MRKALKWYMLDQDLTREKGWIFFKRHYDFLSDQSISIPEHAAMPVKFKGYIYKYMQGFNDFLE